MNLTYLVVPRNILLETHAMLRQYSLTQGVETAILWRGNPAGNVTEVIVPKQRRGYGRFSVTLEERRNIARKLRDSGELIVAQVHTHPHRAFHSPIDDAEAIPRTAGTFSLVIPDFAGRASLLDGAALYQLQENGTWKAASLQVLRIIHQSPTGSTYE